MPRVIHFEIHADNPERAIGFYKNLFDWEFHKWDGPTPYWLVKTGSAPQPGIDGGLIQRQCAVDGQAVIAYVCTVDVPALDGYVEKAVSSGGTIALSKFPIPGVGWLAYCKDTEGNVFGMMQADPKAS